MRIALVEDNVNLAKGIAYQLRDAGHSVDVLHHGDDADTFLRQETGDLVILDINLPGKSGLDLLADLRERSDPRPVILLTARSETQDRVKGLDAGADDYLVKPFEMEELAARIRALGRRNTAVSPSLVNVGPLKFDAGSMQLFDGDVALEVPRRELSLLSALIQANGRTLSKASLLDQLYGAGSETDEKVIEVYVSRLRKRLSSFDINIQVHRGIGYSLNRAS
ncbi:response regulator transcription factor [Roseibium alexandrii]|jgi:two-component system OmpR family response regulator|uniref:Transcriptional regulatory protein tctD n=2 Tax=Roseibium alexandrii TaxID=388408 RepID=A0A0M7AFC7_9HYPH|nr:response regulator transcription factor [Roseibium alexandrii]EEE43634.1 Response regulator [Roseibium alexandrii DFL-11]CTQ73116.1 Transcriptional regulatory protein tctD [Roseibium alexandrii]